MQTKLLEIRDRGTFIPMLAIQLDSNSEEERFLLARAGYGKHAVDHNKYILLAQIAGGKGEIHCDPYDWTGIFRTYREEHKYIIEHWNEIKSGDVIDIEFILGETATRKVSERIG